VDILVKDKFVSTSVTQKLTDKSMETCFEDKGDWFQVPVDLRKSYSIKSAKLTLNGEYPYCFNTKGYNHSRIEWIVPVRHLLIKGDPGFLIFTSGLQWPLKEETS
jgi:hypothetical protein